MTAPRADWSLRPRGPFSAAILSGLALAVAAGVGHEFGADPLWAVGAGAISTLGTLATHLHAGPAPLWYRLACCIGGAGWLTWGLSHGVTDAATMGSLGLGALAAAVLAPVANRPPKPRPSVTGALDHDRPVGRSVVVRRHVVQAEEWVARIRRVAKIRVQVLEFKEWPNRYGFSLLLQQPLGTSTTTRLAQAAVGLAEDKGLDHGCGVEFTPGPRRGTLWMHVSTVNGLAETIPHPGIRLGGSINDPDAIRLGGHRDGKTASVALRESTMVLAGQKRSGKTGTLHDITADAGALDDTLVFQMDLNGGGVSRAWLRPWLQGRTERPAVDWAASCPEEALLMAYALVAIAKDRKSAHADLKAEHDVQLLPVSRDVPAVLLILDEGKEVLGQKVTDPIVRQIRKLLETLVDIGGNEACNAVLSVLRSTSNTLSTEILKQCSTRATMRVFDQSELDYLFGYHKGITPQDAPEQGSGFLASGAGNPRAFKAYYMKPSDIDAAAVAIAEHRPDLDEAAVRAAGQAYATRLERMRYLFATPAQQATMTPPEPIDLPGLDREPWYPAGNVPDDDVDQDDERLPIRRRPGTVERRSHLRLLPTDGVTSGWGDLDTRPARRPSAPQAGTVRAEQVHELDEGGHPVPELLERALELRWDQGRMHSERLANQLSMTEHELAGLLSAIGINPLPNAFERGGVRRRGYERQDLVDTAAAIRRGEIEVPPEVAAWSAA
ncbi:hypothetical protein ABT294_00470 [Nonomuraea sp. NPDC000554]|uniref:hypothetical protein n=1 Tax=Nonomuraea sp. NPDC000554 TaxID=3154259 RepID=UPI0033250265